MLIRFFKENDLIGCGGDTQPIRLQVGTLSQSDWGCVHRTVCAEVCMQGCVCRGVHVGVHMQGYACRAACAGVHMQG